MAEMRKGRLFIFFLFFFRLIFRVSKTLRFPSILIFMENRRKITVTKITAIERLQSKFYNEKKIQLVRTNVFQRLFFVSEIILNDNIYIYMFQFTLDYIYTVVTTYYTTNTT